VWVRRALLLQPPETTGAAPISPNTWPLSGVSQTILDILVLLREELVARAVCPGPYNRCVFRPIRPLVPAEAVQ